MSDKLNSAELFIKDVNGLMGCDTFLFYRFYRGQLKKNMKLFKCGKIKSRLFDTYFNRTAVVKIQSYVNSKLFSKL